MGVIARGCTVWLGEKHYQLKGELSAARFELEENYEGESDCNAMLLLDRPVGKKRVSAADRLSPSRTTREPMARNRTMN
jgi:hypothetical protein